MTEKKGFGNTVLGWFVVRDEDAPPPPIVGKAPAGKAAPAGADAADDLIRRYAGEGPGKTDDVPLRPPGLDAGPAKSPSGEKPPDFGAGPLASPAAPMVPGALIDFDPVFRKAGLSDEERDRVKKALELLSNLPAETPAPVKKQIVETSLKTFGVSVDSIIESSAAELEALHNAINAGLAETQKLMADSQTRIAKLEQQIGDVRSVVTQKQGEQANLEGQARTYGLRVQQILEFFGLERVDQVVKSSPRLKDPTGAKPAAPPPGAPPRPAKK